MRALTQQQQFNHLSIQFNRTIPQSVLVADLSFNAKSKRVKLHIKHTPRSSNICANLRRGASNSRAATTTSATPIAVVTVRTPPLRAPRLQVKLRVKLHVLRHVATPCRPPPPVRLPQLVSNLSSPTAVSTAAAAAVLKQIQQKIYLENCRRSAFVLH